MSAASTDHALIVAGPSGAGKSAFIRDLAERRLPTEIAGHLPALAPAWQQVCCTAPETWQPFLGTDAFSSAVLHYDITTMWFRYDRDFARDPFWSLVDRCGSATLVVIRPSPQRLIAQWCHSHHGTENPRRVAWKQVRAAGAALVRNNIRRLGRPTGDPALPRWRYPRPLRFLKHVDETLRAARVPESIRAFELYRTDGKLAEMMRGWDQAIAARLRALAIKRVEIAPDPAARIGRSSAWRMLGALEPSPEA